MSKKEFIHRTVYKSHIILMIISVVVGVISLTRCPYAVRHVQVDVPQARFVVNLVSESQQKMNGAKGVVKAGEKNVRHNIKPEKKIKELKGAY